MAPPECHAPRFKEFGFMNVTSAKMKPRSDRSRNFQQEGAALVIILAFVVLLTGLVIAYLSRTITDRQLAKASFEDTAAELLAGSSLDIIVSDLRQEIADSP